MTTLARALPRRALVGSLALATLTAAREASLLPEGATVIVAGPEGGNTDRWGEALGRAFAPNRVRREKVGGPDGVTGANQFEALTAPDGGTALLAPGAAATAWLVGDVRAQFDAARWVPVMAGIGSGVLISRVAAKPGSLVRLAVSSVAGPELPGLLGLDLLGVAVEPVSGLRGAAARDALLAGQIDALFVQGPGAAGIVQTLALNGMPALFTVGALDEVGQPQRDRQFPDLPAFSELLARRQPLTGSLYTAWRAVAAAAALDVALVLPRETPAAMVSLWRRACAQAAGSPDLQNLAAMQEARPVVAVPAAISTAAIAADPDTLLELRRWLLDRHGWRPG